jgi:dethiobiotin synthetase
MKENQLKFPNRILITGTDTDVGKTVVSAILMAGLNAVYWKPVQSGLDEITDTQWMKDKTGLPDTHFCPETYRLKLPLSPHAAAAHDGIKIDLDAFKIPETSDTLIIEGAGGIMVPLNEHYFMKDLMKTIDAPIILVSRSSLGTINHTLLSLEYLKAQGLKVMGVVMNGQINSGNKDAIEHYGNIKVLAQIEHMPIINRNSLKKSFKECFINLD